MKIYIVSQITSYMEIDDEKAFVDYETAAQYFLSLVGDWMLMYISEPDIPFKREDTDFSDGAGAQLFEVPCDEKSFEQHEDYIQVGITKSCLIVLRAINLEDRHLED